MTTITIKEFLSNPKDYLDIAEDTAVILTGKKNIKFQITAFEDDDDEFEERYREQILEGLRQIENGETVIIGDGSIQDLKNHFLGKAK